MGKRSTKKTVAESSFEQIDPALGAFVRQFEGLVWAMRRFVIACFKRGGLKKVDLILPFITGVMAGPLRDMMAPIYEQACPEDPNGLEALKEILGKVKMFVQARNHFLHSFYLDAVGPPGTVLTEHYTKGGYSVSPKASQHSVEDLQNYMGYMGVVCHHLKIAILSIDRTRTIENTLRVGLRALPDPLPPFKTSLY